MGQTLIDQKAEFNFFGKKKKKNLFLLSLLKLVCRKDKKHLILSVCWHFKWSRNVFTTPASTIRKDSGVLSDISIICYIVHLTV